MNRGFAHVEFVSTELARKVMHQHQEEALDFGGRLLRLDYAKQMARSARAFQEDDQDVTPRPTLFVGNIPYSADPEELASVFSDIAEIKDVRIGKELVFS